MAAILINTSSQLQPQFSKTDIYIYKIYKAIKSLPEKCLKMVENSSELLFHFHDFMPNILNNFDIVDMCGVAGK